MGKTRAALERDREKLDNIPDAREGLGEQRGEQSCCMGRTWRNYFGNIVASLTLEALWRGTHSVRVILLKHHEASCTFELHLTSY